MRRSTIPALALVLPLSLAAPPIAQAGGADDHHQRRHLPSTYLLDGDSGGSKFEGIGVDPAEGTFYVSEVTGGEIHRGHVTDKHATVWKDEGEDGRFTARGITTDRHGRVYVAGGPNGIDHPGAPDLWVYSEGGRLLAALQVDEDDAFLNDVAIGPDGAAYFTNSNAPQIFRVTRHHGEWSVTTWADATGTIAVQEGFNLGGIVVAPDKKSLVVGQGTTGQLWRFDLSTTEASMIEIGSTDLQNVDGLVIHGRTLYAVRNFDHRIVVLRLDRHATRARQVDVMGTDPDRVFTTAKLLRGRLMLIDSHFDEQVAEPPYQVVARRIHR